MLTADLLSDTVALVCQEICITALNLQGHKAGRPTKFNTAAFYLYYMTAHIRGT